MSDKEDIHIEVRPVCKKEVEVEEERCAVCLGSVSDRTTLNGCTHVFCYLCIYQWCRHKTPPTCPCCKSAIDNLTHYIHGSKLTIEPIEKVREGVDNQRAMEANITASLRLERGFVKSRLQLIRGAIRTIDSKLRPRRLRTAPMDTGCRLSERNITKKLEETKKRLQEELSSLEEILRTMDSQNLHRGDIIQNPLFRRVIYTFRLEYRRLDNAERQRRRAFNPTMCNRNVEEYRDKLVQWILNELMAIPSSDNDKIVPESVSEKLDRDMARYDLANSIFELTTKFSINSPPFHNAVKNMKHIPSSYIDIFARELFEFADSGMTMLEHSTVSTYFSRDSHNSENVITLGDEVEDVHEIPEDEVVVDRIIPSTRSSVRQHPISATTFSFLNSLAFNDDVNRFLQNGYANSLNAPSVSSDNIATTIGNALREMRNESNFVRQREASSSSDDQDLYYRNQLRLNAPATYPYLRSVAPAPNSQPIFWNDLTQNLRDSHINTSPFSAPRNDFFSNQFTTDERPTRSVTDDTIVLDETIAPSTASKQDFLSMDTMGSSSRSPTLGNLTPHNFVSGSPERNSSFASSADDAGPTQISNEEEADITSDVANTSQGSKEDKDNSGRLIRKIRKLKNRLANGNRDRDEFKRLKEAALEFVDECDKLMPAREHRSSSSRRRSYETRKRERFTPDRDESYRRHSKRSRSDKRS